MILPKHLETKAKMLDVHERMLFGPTDPKTRISDPSCGILSRTAILEQNLRALETRVQDSLEALAEAEGLTLHFRRPRWVAEPKIPRKADSAPDRDPEFTTAAIALSVAVRNFLLGEDPARIIASKDELERRKKALEALALKNDAFERSCEPPHPLADPEKRG